MAQRARRAAREARPRRRPGVTSIAGASGPSSGRHLRADSGWVDYTDRRVLGAPTPAASEAAIRQGREEGAARARIAIKYAEAGRARGVWSASTAKKDDPDAAARASAAGERRREAA